MRSSRCKWHRMAGNALILPIPYCLCFMPPPSARHLSVCARAPVGVPTTGIFLVVVRILIILFGMGSLGFAPDTEPMTWQAPYSPWADTFVLVSLLSKLAMLVYCSCSVLMYSWYDSCIASGAAPGVVTTVHSRTKCAAWRMRAQGLQKWRGRTLI